MRTYLVAMTKGRADRASAVCVDDGDAISGKATREFRKRYSSRDIRRVDYAEMHKLMSAE